MTSSQKHFVSLDTTSGSFRDFLLEIDNIPIKCLMPFDLLAIEDIPPKKLSFFFAFALSSFVLFLYWINFLLKAVD